MKNEQGITKNQIIQELAKSPHGNLKEYVPTAQRAAQEDCEFLAHLIAWNERNGQIRDSKVALPVISLSVPTFETELVENSLAHLAKLDPRNLVRAVRFALSLRSASELQHIQVYGASPWSVSSTSIPALQYRRGHYRRLVERYLREREDNMGWFNRTALQHRDSLKALYSLFHVKPSEPANVILNKRHLDKTPAEYRPGSVFEAVANLKNMSPLEAAGAILEFKIPFLIASGALQSKMKDESLVLALINQMSPSELVNNTAMLERLGIKEKPALRAAFEAALAKAATSKKNTLKATKAAEAVTDEKLKAKLQNLQEQQIKAAGGIDGNWLVLGDKSGSMSASIEAARHVAATLAKFVKGKVHLVFFDTMPRYLDVTGKTYDEILKLTRLVQASGGTSIGCGVQYAIDNNFEVDGIAIVSDGEENRSPMFAGVYQTLARSLGKEPPVYYYKVGGSGWVEFTSLLKATGIDYQQFDLGPTVDYYSLPAIVQTMRTNRYSLVDEIMQVPLLTLDEVFDGNKIHAAA
jgi:hypothetical protein